MCVGFFRLLVGVLSPKFHSRVFGPFVDKSVNMTVNGAVPRVFEAVKAATGLETGGGEGGTTLM